MTYMQEEGPKKGQCNNSVTVVAAGGARDQRMQSDVTEGARGEKGVGDGYDETIRSGNDLNDSEKKYFVQRTSGICGVGQWQEPLVQGRGTGVERGEKDGAAEGGAATRRESKDGAEEEEETMMALRRAVLESMTPVREGDNERRRTFNKRQMDRLGAELDLAKQLTAECGVELQLAVRALRETGAKKSGGGGVAGETSAEGDCRIGQAATAGEGGSGEAAEDRWDTAQEEWASVEKLAARGALHRLGWQHLGQERGGKMAAEEAASGDQGGGSAVVKGR